MCLLAGGPRDAHAARAEGGGRDASAAAGLLAAGARAESGRRFVAHTSLRDHRRPRILRRPSRRPRLALNTLAFSPKTPKPVSNWT